MDFPNSKNKIAGKQAADNTQQDLLCTLTSVCYLTGKTTASPVDV